MWIVKTSGKHSKTIRDAELADIVDLFSHVCLGLCDEGLVFDGTEYSLSIGSDYRIELTWRNSLPKEWHAVAKACQIITSITGIESGTAEL